MSLILPGVSASSRLRGGGSSPYVAKAVHFDGSTWIENESLICTNNSVFSLSGWYILNPPVGNGSAIWVSDPSGQGSLNGETTDGGPTWYLELGNLQSGTNIITIDASTYVDGIIPVGWHHFLASVDCNSPQGARLAKFYLDGVDATHFVTDIGDPFSLLINGLDFYFGKDPLTSNQGNVFDASDVWIAPGVSLLDETGDIPLVTRRLFSDELGKPVNPSGFPSSAILFSGDSSTFVTNQGTGGAFTLTGSLTNADSSPSD